MTKVRKLQDRLKIIERNISDLVDDKYIFDKYKEYIENSRNINKNNDFLFFISVNYQKQAIIEVCKQGDTDTRSESLINLLEDYSKVTTQKVNSDISALKETIKSIKNYRNKRGAHYDKGNPDIDLQWLEVEKAIKLLDEMAVKYILLLNECGIADGTLLSANINDHLNFNEILKG